MPLDHKEVTMKVRDNSYAGRLKRLEAFVDVLEARIEQLERVTIVDAPNPTTEWGGKENGKEQTTA